MSALDTNFAKAKKYAVPVRSHAVIITEEGYYPKNIVIFEREKLRIFLTSTSDTPGCLLMPEQKIFMSAKKGKISEESMYFEEAGVYKFYCPTGKIFGTITVLNKETQNEKIKRSVASRPVVKVWRPRNE